MDPARGGDRRVSYQSHFANFILTAIGAVDDSEVIQTTATITPFATLPTGAILPPRTCPCGTTTIGGGHTPDRFRKLKYEKRQIVRTECIRCPIEV